VHLIRRLIVFLAAAARSPDQQPYPIQTLAARRAEEWIAVDAALAELRSRRAA
jgi:hypothetical protein